MYPVDTFWDSPGYELVNTLIIVDGSILKETKDRKYTPGSSKSHQSESEYGNIEISPNDQREQIDASLAECSRVSERHHEGLGYASIPHAS